MENKPKLDVVLESIVMDCFRTAIFASELCMTVSLDLMACDLDDAARKEACKWFTRGAWAVARKMAESSCDIVERFGGEIDQTRLFKLISILEYLKEIAQERSKWHDPLVVCARGRTEVSRLVRMYIDTFNILFQEIPDDDTSETEACNDYYADDYADDDEGIEPGECTDDLE